MSEIDGESEFSVGGRIVSPLEYMAEEIKALKARVEELEKWKREQETRDIEAVYYDEEPSQ